LNHFDYYNQAWVVYVILGIIFLVLVDRLFRHLSLYLRIGLHTLIATLAFTPGTVGDSPSFSPLIVASLLNAEEQGIQPLLEALATFSLTWLALFALVVSLLKVWQKKQTTDDAGQHTSRESE